MQPPASQPLRPRPSRPPQEARFIALGGMPEIVPGDDLAVAIADAAEAQRSPPEEWDIVVVTQKIVSKAEGRVVRLADVRPTERARSLGERLGRDARLVELILRESVEIVRMDETRGILITETRGGFVCANAGIDSSNVAGEGVVSLLPVDPDASAARILRSLKERFGIEKLAVIVTDTFGRAWRDGHVNFAIGVAGMSPFLDYRGSLDDFGQTMTVTTIAVADEVAAAAELVMGKVDRTPVAIARGVRHVSAEGSAAELLRERRRDLFR